MNERRHVSVILERALLKFACGENELTIELEDLVESALVDLLVRQVRLIVQELLGELLCVLLGLVADLAGCHLLLLGRHHVCEI